MSRKIISNISVDCVIFGYDGKALSILLVERTLISKQTSDIIFSDHTLIGNHVFVDEELHAAANRILENLTGLTDVYLEQFHTFSSVDRLSRKNDVLWLDHVGDKYGRNDISKRTITTGYFSLLDVNKTKIIPDNRILKWFPINNIPKLGYDHEEIVEKALVALRNKLRINPIAFELLPEKFTLTQLQTLYEVITDEIFDKRNFRKKILQQKYLIPLDEKQKNVSHKPAQLYMFSTEVFEKTKKEKTISYF